MVAAMVAVGAIAVVAAMVAVGQEKGERRSR